MMSLQCLAITQIHMNATGQARIKAPDSAHYVDALELVRSVFLKDGCVLHCIFVGPGGAVNVSWVGIPGCGGIRVIVCDFAVTDNHVMRQDAAHCFMEPAANRLVRNDEFRPGLGPSGMEFSHCLLGKIKGARRRICLEVRASAIPLDCITPLWNLP